MKGKIGIPKIFIYLILIVASFLSIFPFFWMITGMTNSAVDIVRGKMTFGTMFIENIRILFSEYDMALVLINSLKVTGFTVVLCLLICSMAAYGFVMYKSKVTQRLYALTMLTMMIPFAALMIPLFQIIVQFKLLNSHFALIITGATSVFIIFFFRQSFVTYPYEIIQAARVDGAGEFRIFFRIFAPSMKSTFFAAAIYAFMTSWNSYMWPLIVLQTNDKRTTTLLISYLSSAYVPQYGVIMTAIVLSTLPIIIIFFAFQKQFVQGMLGSLKA
ncbi:MAG: carbohydrate ABC transporter permease [Anaerolineaceae bacterium]|nr:MAG: carbohydrate ABC transporter permease [Anaerolineaceae bacterium]